MDLQIKAIFLDLRQKLHDVFDAMQSEHVVRIGQLAESYNSRFKALTGPQWSGPVTSSKRSSGGGSSSKSAALGFSVQAACLELAISQAAQHLRKGASSAERDAQQKLLGSMPAISKELQKQAAVPLKLYRDSVAAIRAELSLETDRAPALTPSRRTTSATPGKSATPLSRKEASAEGSSAKRRRTKQDIGTPMLVTPTKSSTKAAPRGRDTGLGLQGSITTVPGPLVYPKKASFLETGSVDDVGAEDAQENVSLTFGAREFVSVKSNERVVSQRRREWSMPRSVCAFLQLREMDKLHFSAQKKEAVDAWKADMLLKIMA